MLGKPQIHARLVTHHNPESELRNRHWPRAGTHRTTIKNRSIKSVQSVNVNFWSDNMRPVGVTWCWFQKHLIAFWYFCLRCTDSDSCMQTTFSERPLYGFSKGWFLLISHICSPYDQPLENCAIYIRDISKFKHFLASFL